MTILELEKQYEALQEELLRGEIDKDEFRRQVEQLYYVDALGRRWRIGWYTGKWYREEQGEWVPDQPHEAAAAATPILASDTDQDEEAAPDRPRIHWLAGALIVLLLLAAATLVVGWSADWWAAPPGKDATATDSATAPPATATPGAASATSTPLLPTEPPSPMPRPTATQLASATPTATATLAPTETASPTPTYTGTAQAEPTATRSPSLSGRIYFPVYDPARSTFDIHVYDLAQGTREVFIEQASQPALSPNHERLAYRSWGREQRGISVRELGDGHTWSWVPFAEAARPIWSPNSENIVFPSEQETDRQWRIYRTQGLIIDRVRRHGGDILGRVPAWLPDGRIVYWECPLNECGLYVMQGDGSAPTRLTRGERDTAPAASPDGSQVAFMSITDGNWDIYRTGTRPADALAPAQLTTNPARDGLATWSPDGRWLAFVSDRDGEWAVWAMRPDGSQKQQLFDLGGPLEGEIAFVAPGDQHGWTWETLAWGP